MPLKWRERPHGFPLQQRYYLQKLSFVVLANSSAVEVEIREDAHAILRALNAIEISLRADVDAMEILKHKGKHRG
jgi:hypothetical protein